VVEVDLDHQLVAIAADVERLALVHPRHERCIPAAVLQEQIFVFGKAQQRDRFEIRAVFELAEDDRIDPLQRAEFVGEGRHPRDFAAQAGAVAGDDAKVFVFDIVQQGDIGHGCLVVVIGITHWNHAMKRQRRAG